jgi:hypothetical protein
MDLPEPTRISSGDFFGKQGTYLDQAAKGNVIMLQRHGREHVVMLSPDQFRALLAAARPRARSRRGKSIVVTSAAGEERA